MTLGGAIGGPALVQFGAQAAQYFNAGDDTGLSMQKRERHHDWV